MNPIVVRKSLTRQLLLAACGVLLLLAAADVAVVHRLSSPPEADAASGALTSTGRTQQRSDMLWAALLGVVGGALVAGGGAGAVRRLPVAVVGEDGLELRVAGLARAVAIPWGEIRWLHTGSDGDDERVPTPVLLVHVADPSLYPAEPWSAAWDGATLMVDAGGWDMAASDVVIHGNMALADWRRRQHVTPDATTAATAGDGGG